MAVLRIVLVVTAVLGAVVRPLRLPVWAVPAACVALGLATGAVTWHGTEDAARPLGGALAFLLAAVPLAALLERAGVFTAVAERLGTGRRLVPGLWLLAVAATALLNLDAAVVLLTPLYVRVARRAGLATVAVAAQPLVLAFLASSFLPASNLTNLLATARLDVGAVSFLLRLGPPSVVACGVGYVAYRRFAARLAADDPATAPSAEGTGPSGRPAVRRPLALGAAVAGVLLVGFLAGPPFGVEPWEVVVAVDVVLAVGLRALPLRAIPWGTAVVAGSLAVLAEAVAAGLPLGSLLERPGAPGSFEAFAAGAAGATLVNNLPALVIGLRFVAHGHHARLWPLLLGVNMGPSLLVTGTLATLLWAEAMAAAGSPVRARQLVRLAAFVTLPAAVAAELALVALGPLYR